MRFFISSVRRGLEEERDALPGLINALGHDSVRFEDFTAQAVPSREACLDGVDSADAYLLMLGDAYGDPLPDTGVSPTEEEFTAARRKGIPILVFRKTGGTPEPRQSEFIKAVEDYSSGRFRGSFRTTTELLTAVTEVIREMETAPPSLSWEPLRGVYEVDWISDENQGGFGYGHNALLELHLLPVGDVQSIAVAELEGVAHRLASLGRDAGLFDVGEALNVHSDATLASATTADQQPERGLRTTRRGALTLWLPLPKDSMGSIVDPADIAAKLAQMLQLADELGIRAESITFAMGLGPVDWTVEGSLSSLGQRNSVSMGMSGGHARVTPEDSVPAGAIQGGFHEVARELAARLLHAYRAARG